MSQVICQIIKNSAHQNHTQFNLLAVWGSFQTKCWMLTFEPKNLFLVCVYKLFTWELKKGHRICTDVVYWVLVMYYILHITYYTQCNMYFHQSENSFVAFSQQWSCLSASCKSFWLNSEVLFCSHEWTQPWSMGKVD